MRFRRKQLLRLLIIQTIFKLIHKMTEQRLQVLMFSRTIIPYMTELPISAKQAYQISEQAHNIRGKKLLYTKHDFLELLFQMMKEGEL